MKKEPSVQQSIKRGSQLEDLKPSDYQPNEG